MQLGLCDIGLWLGLIIGLALRSGMGLVLNFLVFQSVLSGTIYFAQEQLYVQVFDADFCGFRARSVTSVLLPRRPMQYRAYS